MHCSCKTKGKSKVKAQRAKAKKELIPPLAEIDKENQRF